MVTGLVATVGGREVYVPIEQASSFDGEVLKLTSARLDLRRFERRDGEVLLRADVLGHRLIDVERAHLIKAADLELSSGAATGCSAGWTRTGGPAGSSASAARRPARAGRAPVPRVEQVRAADRAFRAARCCAARSRGSGG